MVYLPWCWRKRWKWREICGVYVKAFASIAGLPFKAEMGSELLFRVDCVDKNVPFDQFFNTLLSTKVGDAEGRGCRPRSQDDRF